jgi:hypothetical protein
MFKKHATGERGKHGFVAWIAGGSIMKNVTEIDNFLPNFGAGYRFAVQPRMNVRFDFGFGRDNFGFYFNFTEAFSYITKVVWQLILQPNVLPEAAYRLLSLLLYH